MNAPRVLIVSHTYTAAINRAKLDALAQLVTLTVVAPARWRDALFSLQAQTSEPACYALHLLPVRFDGHILRYFYPFRQLSHIAQQARPDLVYVEEEPASLALAQLAFLKRRYGYRLIFFTWENILRRAGLPGLERYNLHRCDGAIAGNREAADVIRRKGFRNPIRVTPQLGIDPIRFQPRRSAELRRSLDLDGFVVGFFGRLVEEKGVRVLIDAVRGLDGAQLLIVGDGPLRASIETSALQVRLEGAVLHERAVELLQAIDVLVLPSLTTPTWKEQFGHVLIEAMACEVPVIGSNSGAIPEVIGDVGLIFPENDVVALRAAIVNLQTNSDRRASLTRAGRARVLARYTHERIAAENTEFFEQVLRA